MSEEKKSLDNSNIVMFSDIIVFSLASGGFYIYLTKVLQLDLYPLETVLLFVLLNFLIKSVKNVIT